MLNKILTGYRRPLSRYPRLPLPLITTIICAIFLITPSIAHANGSAAALCDTQTPQVHVSLNTAKTRYIRTNSAATLSAMHGDGSHATVGGLGGGEIGLETQSQFIVRSQGDKACVSLKSLKVTLYAKPTIMIASNFRRGTCEYQAVLGHEQKHVRALMNFVRQQAPKLRRKVQETVRQSRTYKRVALNDTTAAQKQIQDNLTYQLDAYQNSLLPTLQHEQDGIDNAKEYERVARMCQNWQEKLDVD